MEKKTYDLSENVKVNTSWDDLMIFDDVYVDGELRLRVAINQGTTVVREVLTYFEYYEDENGGKCVRIISGEEFRQMVTDYVNKDKRKEVCIHE